MNDVSQVLHVGISVKNIEKALKWYHTNLGFEPGEIMYVPPLKAKICFIEKDGFQIELFEYDNPKDIPVDRLEPNSDLQTVGTKHVAFLTPDMQALKKRLVANGVDIAHEVNMGTQKVMFIRDPDGVLIEVIQ